MNNDQDKSRSKDASGKPNDSGSKPLVDAEPRREGIHKQAEASPQKEPSIPAVAGKDGSAK